MDEDYFCIALINQKFDESGKKRNYYVSVIRKSEEKSVAITSARTREDAMREEAESQSQNALKSLFQDGRFDPRIRLSIDTCVLLDVDRDFLFHVESNLKEKYKILIHCAVFGEIDNQMHDRKRPAVVQKAKGIFNLINEKINTQKSPFWELLKDNFHEYRDRVHHLPTSSAHDAYQVKF